MIADLFGIASITFKLLELISEHTLSLGKVKLDVCHKSFSNSSLVNPALFIMLNNVPFAHSLCSGTGRVIFPFSVTFLRIA